MKRFTFLLASLSFVLGQSAMAEPTRISNTNTVRLGWPSISNITGYEAKLTYSDGTESESVYTIDPRYTFTPRKGIAFVVMARVCQGEVCSGMWSDGSTEYILCGLVDLDCNGAVGMSDFGILVRNWGTVVYE